MLTEKCNVKTCSPAIECCQSQYSCFSNSSFCSNIKCGSHLCQKECCYQDKYCLTKFHCFLQSNLNILFITLPVLIFLFALLICKKNMHKCPKKKKNKQKQLSKNEKSTKTTKENMNDPINIQDKNEIKENIEALNKLSSPLQTELRPQTEREEFVSSDLKYSFGIEENNEESFEKKDLRKYVLKKDSKLNFRQISIAFQGFFKKIKNRKMISIHIEKPFSNSNQKQNSHKKYHSEFDENLPKSQPP